MIAALEDFITFKTGREVFMESNVPSFLTMDTDFDIPYGRGSAYGEDEQVVYYSKVDNITVESSVTKCHSQSQAHRGPVTC